jgi:hypothetical protein
LAQREHAIPIASFVPRGKQGIERITAIVLLAGLLSIVWMVVRATKLIPGPAEQGEVIGVIAIWVVLFTLVSAIGLYSTRRQ